MAQQIKLIETTEALDLNFATNVTIANIGTAPVHVLTDDEEQAVDGMDLDTRNRVMNAMYSVAPGTRRSLTKGVYRVILSVNARAFLSYGGRLQTPKPTE